MENKSHALAAGAFLLAITALLVVMAAWLMRDTAEHRLFELSSQEAVNGLQPQAAVRYKGVLVGRVASIGLDPNTKGNVLVRLAVNDSAPISSATFATLGFQGVTGLAFVQLDDAGDSSKPLAATEGQVPRIPMRPGMFSRLSDQGASLMTQLDEASRRANNLLDASNQKILMNAVANLGQAAASIQRLSQHADQMLTTPTGTPAPNVAQLVHDASAMVLSMRATSERLAASADAVRSSADEFKRMSARMNAVGGTLDKIAQGSDALAATGQSLNANLVPRLNRTSDDAARTARKLGQAAETLSDNPQSLLLGKGALPPGPGESGFVAPKAR